MKLFNSTFVSHLIPLLDALLLLLILQCTTAHEEEQQQQVIGHGFIDFDGTFDSNRLRPSVFQFPSLLPVTVTKIPSPNPQTVFQASSTIPDLAVSLSDSLSSAHALSKSLPQLFPHPGSSPASARYGHVSLDLQTAHHVLSLSVSALKGHVREDVKHNFNHWTPEQVFKMYGTHVVTGVTHGGSLQLWATGHHDENSVEAFEKQCRAVFKSYIQGPSELSEFETKMSDKVNTFGLQSTGGQLLTVGILAQEEWLKSVESNAQPFKIYRQGVVPLWELVEDVKKGGEMKKFYLNTISSISPMILKKFVSEWSDESPTPQTSVRVPEGWKVLSGGAATSFNDMGQLLTMSYPSMDGMEWHVQSKDHLRIDVGQVQAYAIAIFDPSNHFDVIIKQGDSPGVSSTPNATVSLNSLDASNDEAYVVIGGGAKVQWKQPGCLLRESYPSSKSEWTAAASDHVVASPCSIRTYSIGIRNTDGTHVIANYNVQVSGRDRNPAGALADVGEGWVIAGAGARMTRKAYGEGGSFLTGLDVREDGKVCSASGKDYLVEDKEQVVVHAVSVFGAVFVNDISSVKYLSTLS